MLELPCVWKLRGKGGCSSGTMEWKMGRHCIAYMLAAEPQELYGLLEHSPRFPAVFPCSPRSRRVRRRRQTRNRFLFVPIILLPGHTDAAVLDRLPHRLIFSHIIRDPRHSLARQSPRRCQMRQVLMTSVPADQYETKARQTSDWPRRARANRREAEQCCKARMKLTAAAL